MHDQHWPLPRSRAVLGTVLRIFLKLMEQTLKSISSGKACGA
jgi:hypothetical protein